MRPELFAEVAANLPRATFATPEACIRTAIGRAYYGAYLEAKQLLVSLGADPGAKHDEVPAGLYKMAKQTNDDRFREVAVLIGDLYIARHQSDYVIPARGKFVALLSDPGYAEQKVGSSVRSIQSLQALRRLHVK